MQLTIHHAPSIKGRLYYLHAWNIGGRTWDVKPGVTDDGLLIYKIRGLSDVTRLNFKFRTQDLTGTYWESDDWIRRVRQPNASQVWTFDASVRCLFTEPGSPVTLPLTLRINVITSTRFRGGWIYAWNPYNSAGYEAYFPETSRDDSTETSVFEIPLKPWMAGGFHFKLAGAARGSGDWEPDRANKFWNPCDGNQVWIKSGQVSARKCPIALSCAKIILLHPASIQAPPQCIVDDAVEGSSQALTAISTVPCEHDAEFQISQYSAWIYPDALYLMRISADSFPLESPIIRQFPVDPSDLTKKSTLLLGVRDWLEKFPQQARPVNVLLEKHPLSKLPAVASDCCEAEIGIGTMNVPFKKVMLTRQSDNNWLAEFLAFPGIPYWIDFKSDGCQETRPDGPADNRRRWTPVLAGESTRWFTAFGLAGLTRSGPVTFTDVSLDLRKALLGCAFSQSIVDANVFNPWEMPLGATVVHADTKSIAAGLTPGTWFVVNAPHASRVRVLILNRNSATGDTVQSHPMSLTDDLRYWWCVLPADLAGHGTEYRLGLNDDSEVIDPAARAATDTGQLLIDAAHLITSDAFAEGSWGVVIDTDQVRAVFNGSAWRLPGWHVLSIYEMHAGRFTNIHKDSDDRPIPGFAQVSRELQNPDGYLRTLGVTALQFLPVQEFPSDNSWGYNPSLFFGIESSYGGPLLMARCVRAAHDVGKAVLLDLVYNHLSDSSLTEVAAEVYTDGQTQWGPMLNFDHPGCIEFFRQATVYLWDTFRVDGFRFDSTETIINGGVVTDSTPYVIARGLDGRFLLGSGGGWDFLNILRTALRKSADACGRSWPYLCGENEPNNWGLTNPVFGVQDGQWNFLFSRAMGSAAYNAWQSSADASHDIKNGMDIVQTWVRPYYESVRYAESHDSASGQDDGRNKRIAARPPFRQGLQIAKAAGAATLLCNGIPMIFMGQEVGETRPFSFENLPDTSTAILNPQNWDSNGDNHRVATWYQALLGLRNNPDNGFMGDDSQYVQLARKTIAFARGYDARFFIICTFGTPDTYQSTAWLGLPGGRPYKEILNSSWPAYAVEFETERPNGGYDARIYSGQCINLPYIGAVVLERV